MLTIAHLTDTHFGGHASAAERARAVLGHVAAMSPPVDVVLVTGDIADHGTEAEYAEAREVLGGWAGPAPMLMCPGNHDVREPYARMLRGTPGASRCDEVHDVAGVRFVMLDSLVSAPEGERIDHGHLAEESLEVLDEALAAGHPTYLCLHHPPVTVHVQLMDPIRLDNADRLAEVIGRHDNLVATFVGHAHSACATTYAGRPLLVGGATASTVTLDAEHLPLITAELPPSFAIHLVAEDHRVVTHWRTV
ncbi:metallophosphoesterase [Nocardioides sp.]|uniref:metallophosphoesterase n=1 Tax=Nocardioides sp. TaxID=35761 RepID=UPI002732358F|nr:metallophosphoesterase [Nocardioides sp.]MDP3894908.1 metallophosphoesterase [Nocardioides sp.]